MKLYILACVCSIAVPTSAAMAASGAVIGGPIGATDIGNAYLPKNAGVYLGVTNYFGWSTRLYNNEGHVASGSSAANVAAAYLMYVWPTHPFGLTIASGLQSGYEAPGHVAIRSSRTPDQLDQGWRDLYVDFLNVSKYVGSLFGERIPSGGSIPYGLTLKAEYSMIFPTGHYDAGASATPSSGTTFYIPNGAITYLTPPDIFGGGVEFNLHAFLDLRGLGKRVAVLHSVPVTVDYANGNLIDLDYAVAQKFGRFSLGLAGSYAFQIQDDRDGSRNHLALVAPKGDRLALLTLGPIFQMAIPSIHATFKIKAPIAISARNTLGVNGVIANFFVPL